MPVGARAFGVVPFERLDVVDALVARPHRSGTSLAALPAILEDTTGDLR
jgi:hypothetical protein